MILLCFIINHLATSVTTSVYQVKLREGARECVAVLSEMYHTLIEGKDRYFINQWTLSREGRKKNEGISEYSAHGKKHHAS